MKGADSEEEYEPSRYVYTIVTSARLHATCTVYLDDYFPTMDDRRFAVCAI